jgi:hypothetical protein
MPFPLAHPAAVLPLRRWCPRWLDFPALVVGSVCPDAGYAFGRWGIQEFSHTPPGSVVFCLPVGLLMLRFFYGLRSRAVGRLPERGRKLFLPLCQHPAGSRFAVVVSLLAGIWTHLLWDSCTQVHGWLAERWTFLQRPLHEFGDQTLRVQHLAWYGCSFAGIAWLYFAFEQWQEKSTGAAVSSFSKWRRAVVIAALFFPVEAMHHLVYGMLGNFVVGAGSLVLVAVLIAWQIGAGGRRKTP